MFAAYVNATPALVTGYVKYQNGTGVENAIVDVTCEHLNINTTLSTTSYSDGSYYQEFTDTQCSYNDIVWVNAEKSGIHGSSDGQTCTSRDCFIPIALIDVTIPEFGLFASIVAVIGALGIVVLRKRN